MLLIIKLDECLVKFAVFLHTSTNEGVGSGPENKKMDKGNEKDIIWTSEGRSKVEIEFFDYLRV